MSHRASIDPSGESKRDKKRREWVEKVESKHQERLADRDRMYIETHQALSQVASSLLPLPPTSQSYLLSLYTLTLERDALLSQIEHHHDYRLEMSKRLFEAEKDRLEDEYRKARENVKGTLLERVEDRRKRLREEKESDNIFDNHPLPPLPSAKPSTASSNLMPNRNLRPSRHTKAGSTDPETALASGSHDRTPLLITDDLLNPSPFSLAIFSHPSLSRASQLNSPYLHPAKKVRGNNLPQPALIPPQPGEERIFTYIPGKSLLELAKLVKSGEGEIDGDLGEIRRGGKGRGRRGAATKAETAFAAANRA